MLIRRIICLPLIQETWSQAKSELVRNKERGLDKSTKKAVLTKQNFLLSSTKTDTIFEITVSVMIIQGLKSYQSSYYLVPKNKNKKLKESGLALTKLLQGDVSIINSTNSFNLLNYC